MKRFALLLVAGIGFIAAARGGETTNTVATPALPDDPLGIVLEDACKNGDLNQVTVLIDQGAPLEAKIGRLQVTPLMVACTKDLELTRLLLRKGAKLDVTDAEGNTALNLACHQVKTDCALALLDAGANPNLANQRGETPLINAAGDENDVLVTALLAHHANPDENTPFGSALTWAIYCNRITAVQLLLDAGADVNLVPPPRPRGSTYAPLHAAASTGNLPIMEMLFARRATIDLLDSRDMSPLMAAADAGQAEAVQELLDHAAKVDLPCKDLEWTALMMAAHKGYLSVAEALVNNHANLELRDHLGRTALVIAARHLQGKVVQLLVDNGAKIDASDAQGETALTYAGNRGDSTLVNWLKNNGAKNTPLHVIPFPPPQPPLSAARSWALAVSAVYIQWYGGNPHRLGYGEVPDKEMKQAMQDRWKVTDRATLLQALANLQQGGPRIDWRQKGARLAALSDDQFRNFLVVNTAAFATPLENFDAKAIRDSYVKWKDRIGLAWAQCVYANLVNRGYTLHYLGESEAWPLLLANARQVQASFGSWREMSDNFQDGRAIFNQTHDPQLDACTQLLLNPNDPNSPWNQNPWKTDLAGN